MATGPVRSESKELGRAIDAIKRAARLMDADPNDAQANLEEAVWTLSQLRYNAMRGLHANPPGPHPPNWRRITPEKLRAMTDDQLRTMARMATTYREHAYWQRAIPLINEELERRTLDNPRVRLGPRRKLGRGLRYEGRRAFSYVGAPTRGPMRPGRRLRNPTLAVLGVNPPRTLKASWATLEYQRPDDPDGKNVARVHEFPDGFIAEAMEDGSVLLKHPAGRSLWTTRKA